MTVAAGYRRFMQEPIGGRSSALEVGEEFGNQGLGGAVEREVDAVGQAAEAVVNLRGSLGWSALDAEGVDHLVVPHVADVAPAALFGESVELVLQFAPAVGLEHHPIRRGGAVEAKVGSAELLHPPGLRLVGLISVKAHDHPHAE